MCFTSSTPALTLCRTEGTDMSIASELTDLANNKAAIKAAIAAKNPTVPPTDALAQWPTAIASIPEGGGGHQGYTLTINADYSMGTGPAAYAFSHSDGTIEARETYNTLYRAEQIVVHDVVSYVGFKSMSDNIEPETPVTLTGDTTIYSPASCLLKGTLVTLADGTQKKIEDITYDDQLLVWDFEKAEFGSAKPIWVKKVETTDYMFNIKFASGNRLDTTGPKGHRAFNIDEGKFVYLNDSVGQRVKTMCGIDEVVCCEKRVGMFNFYNIITKGHLNLFANGILTSCRLNNYRQFDVKRMCFDGAAALNHRRDDFPGLTDDWIEGLHLCEQPSTAHEITKYVLRLHRSGFFPE